MTKYIMMVDDDPEILRLYRTIFKRHGHVLLEAPDAASALKMLESSTPDLFVLDVMMPEINGFELCEQIRAMPQHEHTPVLILSAWGDTETVEKTFAAGANDYLVKPVHPREFEAKIEEMLALAEVASQ